MIKAKVQAGEYASESEVFREGLRILQGRERAFERWLREEAAKGFDVFPERGSVVMTCRPVFG